MRISFSILLLLCFASACGQTNTDQSKSGSYSKEDLKKIKWIEGKWRGMHNNKPFYEIYQMENDSTLKITSYEWNGRDSANTSYDYVYWRDGAYYFGKEQNWKVLSISDSEVRMLPNYKANNDIIWRYNNNNAWVALLTSNKGTTRYDMEKFDPFRSR